MLHKTSITVVQITNNLEKKKVTNNLFFFFQYSSDLHASEYLP